MNIAKKDTSKPTMLDESSETLLEAERLHALGQAASAIAHDIDVAMAPITLYTEAMLEHETLSDRARHYLSSIRRAVHDVSHNVARLRELDRRRDEMHRANPHTDRPSYSVRSLRVLLIDDDPSLIEALRSSLADEGHKVSTAGGGQVGIDTFRAARGAGLPFDIVITDLSMPDVDGHQVVASLRAISPATPIILLTGWRHQLKDGAERLLHVDRLLGKPPRIRELRTALAELTGRRTADRPG
jgi:CheY-like chemotaxis protein